MPTSYADNAIYAKVKALYGGRLTAADYEQLLHKRSVGEVAAYLKRETVYAQQLREVKEHLIHRGQLENLLRRRPLDIYLRLRGYSYADDGFLRLFVLRSESELLLQAIRMMRGGSMDQFIVTLPAYLARYTSYDLFALAQVRSPGDLLDALRHTPYREVLLPFLQNEDPPDVTACETALVTEYFRLALELVKARYQGETQEGLQDMLLSQIDLYNIAVIHRMKRFRNAGGEEIDRHLIPLRSGIRPAAYRRLTTAPDYDVLLARMQEIPMLRGFLPRDGEDVEWSIERYRQASRRRTFRFSTQPVVVLLNYMVLLEIEISNIVNIIEGTRYQMQPEEIRPLLVMG